jgi:hypothetical protein
MEMIGRETARTQLICIPHPFPEILSTPTNNYHWDKTPSPISKLQFQTIVDMTRNSLLQRTPSSLLQTQCMRAEFDGSFELTPPSIILMTGTMAGHQHLDVGPFNI